MLRYLVPQLQFSAYVSPNSRWANCGLNKPCTLTPYECNRLGISILTQTNRCWLKLEKSARSTPRLAAKVGKCVVKAKAQYSGVPASPVEALEMWWWPAPKSFDIPPSWVTCAHGGHLPWPEGGGGQTEWGRAVMRLRDVMLLPALWY